MRKIAHFLLAFIGGFVGILCYSLLTSPMEDGVHLKAVLILGAIFGAIFALLATILAQRYWQYIYCSIATYVLIGISILALIGTDRLIHNLANGGWAVAALGLILTGLIPGSFGFLATRWVQAR